MDLAVPCLASNHVAIFLGKGDGSFDSPRVVPTLDKPKGVALGDLDLDGHADLFVAGLHSAAVHFGKGSGEFGEPVLLLAEEARRSYWSPAIADISGDSIPDLLVADAGSKNVLFLRGKGGRQFEESVPIAVSGAPRSIVAVDLDGDGLLDVTTANNNQNLSLIFNLGQEGFQAPVDLHDGLTNVSGHQVLDLNRDGVLDLVAFGPGSSIIFFGRSKSTPAPGRFRRGDVDGNAKVQVSDAIVLLNHLFRGGALECQDAGDTDDNGEVNLTDAVVTLRWLFQGGSPPGPPGPEDCGADPTRDELKECKPECR
ncbi:MAG: hypothetical protein AUI36_23715 [Cyanobacteria bacterium 13_1_40CM_2_61_4]|nr:MAG: hypothetical protein AUI36_23715 [Cyanobacteria bacterium 13_1_40CM_2_61_4]